MDSGRVIGISAIVPALAVLWAQFFVSLAPVWGDGTYYSYGWYVPPLAAWFFARRWREAGALVGVGWDGRDSFGLAGFLVLLLVVRVLGGVDPLWRLPMWGHALLVVVATLWWVRAAAGWRFAWSLWPVLVFALTCLPYPTAVETKLVHGLTRVVIGAAVEAFTLFGKPVVAVGEKLTLGSQVMEVTEGCSGIRSFQSFLMAAVFFGELFRLRMAGRAALLMLGLVLAVAVNVGRAMVLSAKGFADGAAAAAEIHDAVGLAAFALSACVFFALAVLLDRFERPRAKITRRIVGRQ